MELSISKKGNSMEGRIVGAFSLNSFASNYIGNNRIVGSLPTRPAGRARLGNE
jgi:hypothetical protein